MTLMEYQFTVVDFDLEYGPKITKTYPPLTLTPSENENMWVLLFLSNPTL